MESNILTSSSSPEKIQCFTALCMNFILKTTKHPELDFVQIGTTFIIRTGTHISKYGHRRHLFMDGILSVSKEKIIIWFGENVIGDVYDHAHKIDVPEKGISVEEVMSVFLNLHPHSVISPLEMLTHSLDLK